MHRRMLVSYIFWALNTCTLASVATLFENIGSHTLRFLDHMSAAHASRSADKVSHALETFFGNEENALEDFIVQIGYHADLYMDAAPSIIDNVLSACVASDSFAAIQQEIQGVDFGLSDSEKISRESMCIVQFLNAHAHSQTCLPNIVKSAWLHNTAVLSFMQCSKIQSSPLALHKLEESVWTDFPPELCSVLHAHTAMSLSDNVIRLRLKSKCLVAIPGIGTNEKFARHIPHLNDSAFVHMQQPMSSTNANALSARQLRLYGTYSGKQNCQGLPLASLSEKTVKNNLVGDCLASFLEDNAQDDGSYNFVARVGRNARFISPKCLEGQNITRILSLMHPEDMNFIEAAVWKMIAGNSRIFTQIPDSVLLPTHFVPTASADNFVAIQNGQIVRQIMMAANAPLNILSHSTADFLSARKVDISSVLKRKNGCAMLSQMSSQIGSDSVHGCALINTKDIFLAVTSCSLDLFSEQCLSSIPLHLFYNNLEPSVRQSMHVHIKSHGLPDSFIKAYSAESWTQHGIKVAELLPEHVAQLSPSVLDLMRAEDIEYLPFAKFSADQMAVLHSDVVAGIEDWSAIEPQHVIKMSYSNLEKMRATLLRPEHITNLATDPSVLTGKAIISAILAQWDELDEHQRGAIAERARAFNLAVPTTKIAFADLSDKKYSDTEASGAEQHAGFKTVIAQSLLHGSSSLDEKTIFKPQGHSAPAEGYVNSWKVIESCNGVTMGGFVFFAVSVTTAIGYLGYRRGALRNE